MTGPRRQDGGRRGPSPHRASPAYEEVADRLRRRIAEGTLTPGDRLPAEANLATEFGVSRSTVREALRVLNSEGLLRTARGVNGGSFVIEAAAWETGEFLETRLGILARQQAITPEELLETRALLEVAGAALAAERRTDDHLDELRAALELESDFHLTLLAAAQNRLLAAMTTPFVQLLAGDDPAATDRDHQRILERIEARDPAGAAAAMEQHLAPPASAGAS